MCHLFYFGHDKFIIDQDFPFNYEGQFYTQLTVPDLLKKISVTNRSYCTLHHLGVILPAATCCLVFLARITGLIVQNTILSHQKNSFSRKSCVVNKIGLPENRQRVYEHKSPMERFQNAKILCTSWQYFILIG